MGFADKYNKVSNVRFTFQADSTFEFFKLGDLLEENGGDEVYTLRGVWISTGGIYGDTPVAVLDDRFVNLPGHMLETVKQIMSDPESVEDINNGKVGFIVRSYVKTLKGKNGKSVDKICYSIDFVDIQ